MSVSTVPTIASVIGLAKPFESLQVRVDSPDSELAARNYLQDVRKTVKQLDKDVKALKAPIKQAIDDIDAAVKPWRNLLDKRDAELESALLVYGRKVREAAEIAQRKLMEKYEQKVAKVEAKAEAQGKPMPVVLPPPIIAAPPKSVQLEAGSQTTVKRKAWRLNPMTAGIMTPDTLTASDNAVMALGIPLEYFVLDTARIGKIVRAGGSIPGIDVYEEESIAVRG
jgi:hypothetical protein